MIMILKLLYRQWHTKQRSPWQWTRPIISPNNHIFCNWRRQYNNVILTISFFPQTSHDGGTRSSETDGHENDAVHDGRPRRRRASGRAAGPAGLVSGRHVARRRRARRRRRLASRSATATRTLRPVAASSRFAHVLNGPVGGFSFFAVVVAITCTQIPKSSRHSPY